MNRSCLWLIFPALASLCISCYTYVTYPVTTPPEIETDAQRNRIAFLNRYDFTSLRNDNEKERAVYLSGARMAIKSLESSFTADNNFEFILIDTLLKGAAPANLPVVLDPDTIRYYCEKAGADMLLAFESFKPDFSIETVSEEDEGGRSTTNYVDLIVEAGLSLYDRSGDVINRIVIPESKHYQTRPALSRFIVIGPSMGKAGEDVDELALRVGPDYIQSFYPGSLMVMKKIYIGKDFAEVTPLFRRQDYRGAVELLKPLAGSTDKKLAGRAAHNLGVAYEAMGDYDASDYWMRHSGNE
jgi:hypothetical protein